MWPGASLLQTKRAKMRTAWVLEASPPNSWAWAFFWGLPFVLVKITVSWVVYLFIELGNTTEVQKATPPRSLHSCVRQRVLQRAKRAVTRLSLDSTNWRPAAVVGTLALIPPSAELKSCFKGAVWPFLVKNYHGKKKLRRKLSRT